jgi:hypothetical protein
MYSHVFSGSKSCLRVQSTCLTRLAKQTEQTIDSTHFPAKTAPPEQIVASRFAVKGGLWSDRHINLFCPGGSHATLACTASAMLNPNNLLSHGNDNLERCGMRSHLYRYSRIPFCWWSAGLLGWAWVQHTEWMFSDPSKSSAHAKVC